MPGALTQVGYVLTFFGEDGPDVFEVKYVLNKGLEILVAAEKRVKPVEIALPRSFALWAKDSH